MARPVYCRACVCFKNGYYLEFEPSTAGGFPPQELVKLNAFAKKRSAVLFVSVEDDGDDE